MKIALIGCGHISDHIYAPILSEMVREVQVKAVCDLDAQRASGLAAKRFPQASVFTDISTLLEEVKIDGALVLTSEKANASTATQILLKGGILVYLEKPPAISMTELTELMVEEAKSASGIYAAFNRRHIPLFQHLKLPSDEIRKVTGKLLRKERNVASFPFTCVHLLDSAQFFGRSAFAKTEVVFEQNGVSSWTLSGQFENGASCELTFIPDGEYESEFLIYETRMESWEFQFQEKNGALSQVRLIHKNKNMERREMTDFADHPHEIMGYAPCFRQFLHYIHHNNWSESIHRLASCRRTIEIMETLQMSQGNLMPA